MADEISYGPNVVGQFLGERQRFADETGQTLPQRVVEAFDVIGFPVWVPKTHRNHTSADERTCHHAARRS